MLCFPMLISSLPRANPLLLEHKIEVFVRFCPSGPSFSGVSSTKSGFLCSFTKLDVGLGHFPADRGIVALAEPLHLRSRRICAADTTAAYNSCT